MRIGVDIMGGDFAPEKTIHGAILACNELSNNEHIVLIGNKKSILQELLHHKVDENQLFLRLNFTLGADQGHI